MNTTTAYTPLESLLLFQSLAAYGTDPNVFARISDLLKNNSLVKDGDSFDAGRLSPDALRELYVQLLREELKSEGAQSDGIEEASPSKKRKIQGSSLPTIKDPNQYNEKLPQLVDRLYARYRDYMIRSIREDEKRYDVLQREIAEIERGEWDERVLREDRARGNKSTSVSADEARTTRVASRSLTPSQASAGTSVQNNRQSDIRSYVVPQQKDGGQQQHILPPPSSNSSPRTESKPEGLAISDVLNSQESAPPVATPADERDSILRTHNGPQSLPPLDHHRTASGDRPHGPPTLQPVQHRPGESWKWEQYQAGSAVPQQSHYPNSGYPPYSTPQYPPYPQPPARGSFATPHGLQPPQGHLPSSPLNATHSNPVILPPPNVGRLPDPSSRPLEALADIAEQQYRAPSASPSMQQGPLQGAGYNPPYPGYAPQYRPEGVPPSPNAIPPHWNQQYVPQYAPPPSYNYPQQPQTGRPYQVRPEIPQPEQRQYNSPYNPSQGPRSAQLEPLQSGASSSTPRPPPLRDTGIPPQTPASSRSRFSTGNATRWTPVPTASTPRTSRSPTRPSFEPISPILPAAKLSSASRSSKLKDASAASKPRDLFQRRNQRTRASSTASSVIAGSYRSQSIASHADELSLDNDGVGSKVKQESSTPRAADETGDTTADESTTRRRRGALRDIVSPRRVTKRKRQESPEGEPSLPPSQVLWTRNFPKISASALDRIGAHRSASTFAQPIKERDAPGYKDVILRPQDLKSIRTAVIAGSKVGAALDDQGLASVMLPISEDLIPPKGIVNNSQLEKELMLMFANAIMFNPDPDRGFGRAFEVLKSVEEVGGEANYEVEENGVVKDTRAMFPDVEKIVAEMRSAERRSEGETGDADEDEADELAGDGDHGGSVAKRRRRA